jgi:hypothetical protein
MVQFHPQPSKAQYIRRLQEPAGAALAMRLDSDLVPPQIVDNPRAARRPATASHPDC